MQPRSRQPLLAPTLHRTLLALLCVCQLGTPEAAQVRELPLPTNDLIYNAVEKRLYASVPSRAGAVGNSVVAVDPERGVVERSVFVGSEPGQLALSDDGRYLYVALEGSGAVRRVELRAMAAGLQFSLGTTPRGVRQVADMAVMPGNPGTLAISRRIAQPGLGGDPDGIAVYDDGDPRPVITPSRYLDGHVQIEFSSDPSRLYAHGSTEYGFRRMTVDESGVTFADPAPVIGNLGFEIAYEGGLIYSSQGRVIDPEAQVLLGTYFGPASIGFPTLLGSQTVAPDSEVGRVYFLAEDPYRNSLTVRAYDQQTFLPVGTFPVPGVRGRASRLVRWGRDGLAFRTDQDQLFLIRSPLVPAEDLVLSFMPPVVRSGVPVSGRIDLRGAAPSGGVTIPLSNEAPGVVELPAEVSIPAGATSATFPVNTRPVSAETRASVSAVYGGRSWPASLQVVPPFRVILSLGAARLVGSRSTTGTLVLSDPAPAGGVTVALASDRPEAAVPERVTVPGGAVAAQFPVSTVYVTQPTPVKITALYGELDSIAELTLLPPSVASLSLRPSLVVGGQPVTGIVGLDAPAPPGGIQVHLSGGRPNAFTLPPTVTVEAGQTTATFRMATSPVRHMFFESVYASAGGESRTATLTVVPSAVALRSLAVEPARSAGGRGATGVVTLEQPAPAGGIYVSLSSSHIGIVVVTHAVYVPAGKLSATFPIGTRRVRMSTAVTLTAALGEQTKTATLTLFPEGIASLVLRPTDVRSGSAVIGTVTLHAPAPSGDAIVSVGSSQPAIATVPARVTIPEGAVTVNFPILTRATSTTTTVVISAGYAGELLEAELTVRRR